MSAVLRFSALTLAASLLAACGGGGGGTSAPVMPAKATTAPASKTPVATATLNIAFPANFHTATLSSKAAAKTAASIKAATKIPAGSRRPAYVNPGTGTKLSVFVVDNGVVVQPAAAFNLAVNPANSALQTISVPLYSNDSQSIVAIETVGNFGSENSPLSIGETEVNGFTPGTSPTIGLTMQMAVQYVGLMTGTTDAHADAFATSVGNNDVWDTAFGSLNVCSPNTTLGPLYAFAADSTGGFIATGNFSPGAQTGAGGISVPLFLSYFGDAGTNASVSPDTSAGSGNVGYNVKFIDGNGSGSESGVELNFSVTNPAEAIFNDYYFNGGSNFPGITAVENFYNTQLSESDSMGLGQIIETDNANTRIDVQSSCP